MYAVRHRKDGDDANVIAVMFFIYNVTYVTLIEIGSTHSYVSSTTSKNLGISTECTTREIN